MLDTYIVGVFVLLLFPLKYLSSGHKNKLQNPKKILVIRLWALGSSILSFPMVKQLKDHYWDNVQYDLLATSRNIGVFKNQGYFNRMHNLFSWRWLLYVFSAFRKYDIVIDVEEYFKVSTFLALWLGKKTIWFGNLWNRRVGYTNPVIYNDHQHTIVTFLDLLGPLGIKASIPEAMEPLVYKEKDTIKVQNFLSQFPTCSIICMHTWGAETAKERARPAYKWVTLIQALLAKYKDIVIVLSGTSFEQEIVQEILDKLRDDEKRYVINICGMFNLFEFACLLKKCVLMVSNDTGPMHLAAAMWTQTIGLFGPELPRKFGPWPLGKNIWLYKWKWEAFIKVHLAQWKKDKEYTIDKISVDDVLKEINLLK